MEQHRYARLTLARHSDRVAFLQSTELAAVSTVRRDVASLVCRTPIGRCALHETAPEEALKSPRTADISAMVMPFLSATNLLQAFLDPT